MSRFRVVVEIKVSDELVGADPGSWGRVAGDALVAAGAIDAASRVTEMRRARVGERKHGSRSTYSAGCRCDLCREAERDHKRRQRAAVPPKPRVLKSHCKHGHEFTPENTIVVRGVRVCRACKNTSRRESLRRRRGEA